METHLDPPEFIGVDLFAGRADHDRGLRAVYQALAGGQRRAIDRFVRLQGEFVAVAAATAALRGQVVAPVVPDRQDHVLDVELVERVVVQGEGVARCQRADLAVATVAQVAGLLGLHDHLGQVLAGRRVARAALRHEPARVAIAFQVVVRADVQHGRGVLANRAALLVVPVVQGHLAGAHLLGAHQGADRVEILGVPLVVERQFVRIQRGIAVLVVGQHQDVLRLAALVVVAEVVVDALALDQARDEVEGGLVVLRAVLELRVGLGQLQLEVAECEFAEDRLDDVRHREVLEDPAILVLCEHPEPRNDVAFVGVEVAFAVRGRRAAGLREARDIAVPVALAPHVAAVPAFDPQDRPLADDLARVDVVALGQQAQAELEQLRDRLVPGHFLDQQVVLPIFLQGEEVHPVAGGKAEGHVSMPWVSLAIVGGVAPSRHSSEELCVADAVGHGMASRHSANGVEPTLPSMAARAGVGGGVSPPRT